MADYILNQTGEQVQQILNDAPTTKETAEQTVTNLATETTNRENADTTLQQNIDAEETARENADTTLQGNIAAEETARENADTTLQGNIDAEETARENADTTLQQNINTETTNRISGDNNLQTLINNEAGTRSGADTTLQNNIDAEETRAKAAEQANADDIDDIEAKIPAAASSSNQLADKDFVNSSIATNTSTFRGTSATGLTYEQFLSWANGLTKDDNDYIFWDTVDSNNNRQFRRYKYNGSDWVFEYTLNNSSFTADQWAAINSAITSGDVEKLSQLPTRAQLDALLEAKQNTLTFDTTPTENSNNPVRSGGVKAALDGKQSTLTFDNQPTQYSDNPVKSGGLYDIWQAILTSISNEATARGNADNNLQTQINAIKTPTVVTSIPDDLYVLLQAGDGTTFKKALASYIDNRIAEKLGAIIAGTDLSTNIAKVVGLNSSNGLGVNTISQLASVLGRKLEQIGNFISVGTLDFTANNTVNMAMGTGFLLLSGYGAQKMAVYQVNFWTTEITKLYDIGNFEQFYISSISKSAESGSITITNKTSEYLSYMRIVWSEP